MDVNLSGMVVNDPGPGAWLWVSAQGHVFEKFLVPRVGLSDFNNMNISCFRFFVF